VRDIETIDAELRLVAALRRAARERGGPLPSIDVADALLDETPRADRTSPPDQLPGLSLKWDYLARRAPRMTTDADATKVTDWARIFDTPT
jgi:hypothetical protein